MNRRFIPLFHSFRACFFNTLTIATACAFFTAASSRAGVEAVNLRCESLADPEGIDTMHPLLSWELKSSARGESQSAYEILVASSPSLLAGGKADLWDSGKMLSGQSIKIPYAGETLKTAQDCFWKIRVWDSSGKSSGWSKPAHWIMGILSPSDWQAQWIGHDLPSVTNHLSGTSWIWFPTGEPEKSAAPGNVYFRRIIELPTNRDIVRARILYTGDDEVKSYINGRDIGGRDNYRYVRDQDITYRLNPGKNTLCLVGMNKGDKPKHAGVVARIEVQFRTGEPVVICTDDRWKSSSKEVDGWIKEDFDDSTWVTAKVIGPVGMEPWGEVRTTEERRQPARYLRREFTVEKGLKRATVFYSGLGWSELYLNGGKVGDEVLSPGLTDYTRRSLYLTHEITKQLHTGPNAFGAVLGNGLFYSPRSKVYAGMQSYGAPKLLLHLRLEYQDGTVSHLVSDASWKITTDGPILANNFYDGEEYDARLELGDWTRPGFDDSKWRPAEIAAVHEGDLSAQMMNPVRVTGRIKPVSVKEPAPGMFVFDMGQNMVGWCKLNVRGTMGDSVTLRFAEGLLPDGKLYMANLRGAKVTDSYTLKGGGKESWEPRFTYHGFRYVEITGFPGKPDLSAVEGIVVNDDLPSAGDFATSDELLNKIYRNVVWGVRGNYHSIPTDCPQRDERQGWLGDRSEECIGESYIFDIEPLYAKWTRDMADSQRTNGSIPDVCPPYWPLYKDNVTWPSSIIIIPEMLRREYANTDVIRTHYASAKLWMTHMNEYVSDGIISKDNYGDWCVPPEDPALIHSKDTNRITAKALLATSYWYHDLRLMGQYATLLGKTNDAREFAAQAEVVKKAFNDKFLNRELGQYDNGTQTSCVLPLAFGLVPEDLKPRIFSHLTEKISNESHNHIGTGLIGGQYLDRVLTSNGRADLALTIAQQRDYPGWGYMVEHGATTIWELWNGNTADPAMNSGNHVMLVGDLVIWFYENLAGISPDASQPGFKHLIMKPEPVGDLTFVKASHRSPYGKITSEWHKKGAEFDWDINIPANSTATVYIPAANASQVRESGKTLDKTKGVKLVKYENGRAVMEVQSGEYHFKSSITQ
jgi:alpha-L-rhamnosidase